MDFSVKQSENKNLKGFWGLHSLLKKGILLKEGRI